MSIGDLPPELIAQIVSEIPEFERRALLACSLSSSMFRHACQERLHRRIELSAAKSLSVAKHFAENPQFSLHVIVISFDASKNHGANTDKLDAAAQWEGCDEGMVNILLDWCAQRPPGSICSLSVLNLRYMPAAIMRRLLLCAPKIATFDSIKLANEETGGPIPPLELGSNAGMVELSAPGSGAVLTLLVQPACRFLIHSLCSLDVHLHSPSTIRPLTALCAAAANTLQYINLNETVFDYMTGEAYLPQQGFQFPSHLPQLRHLNMWIEKGFIDGTFEPPWLVPDTLLPLLAPSVAPLLQRVTIGVGLDLPDDSCDWPADTGAACPFGQGLLHLLDEAFVNHPALDYVQWKYCPISDVSTMLAGDPEDRLTEAFVSEMRAGLVKSLEKGLVELVDEIEEWIRLRRGLASNHNNLKVQKCHQQIYLSLVARAPSTPTGTFTVPPLDALYDQLSPVTPELLLGDWLGGDFDTGHPTTRALRAVNWAGKTFRTTEDVDPVVVWRDGKRVWMEKYGRARIREVKFRGLVSAAMVYDAHPIIDHFRCVDENTVAGYMDVKGAPPGYHFYLTRIQAAKL
ncbi:FAD binding domain-containing protein [Mycena kentingensis (nom. inval.)]|nr:FAD binding domain-containing protein [Mycena kentingensis (nom. inval.)]